MHIEFTGGDLKPNDIPNVKESKRFWDHIWSVRKGHNQGAELMKDLKNELINDKHLQETIAISVEKLTKQCMKMTNWKAPGKDNVHSYWIKNS